MLYPMVYCCKRFIISGLVVVLSVFHVVSQNNDIEEFLKMIPKAQVTTAKVEKDFKGGYLIMLQQPIDHSNLARGTFSQRIWLSHFSKEAPVVLVTSGYDAPKNYTTELSNFIKANQIIVEHRYYGQSTPSPKDWKFLTVEQAANDHHKIVELFKGFYTQKWINTGVSKGGATTLFHRAFFPEDVDVSVPYVAPINMSRVDQRLFDFFEEVGTEGDRKRIFEFQKLIFQNKEKYLPLVKQVVERKGWEFSMGIEKAYELAVLEYPFAMWQWGISIGSIPALDAKDIQIVNHFIDGAGFDYFSNASMSKYESFFYQAYRELGYYSYLKGSLKSYFSVLENDTIDNSMFAPGGDSLQFNSNTMEFVMERLRKNNPKIISISGETDPWGATSLIADELSNTIKVIKKNGSHLTRIKNLEEGDRKMVLEHLNKWLKE
ncbi:peptidase [bacterium]|nr:peptidase [bacterium]